MSEERYTVVFDPSQSVDPFRVVEQEWHEDLPEGVKAIREFRGFHDSQGQAEEMAEMLNNCLARWFMRKACR
jgi:hypothetical protein